MVYSKACVKQPPKKMDKTKILITYGSLMKVELQHLRPALIKR